MMRRLFWIPLLGMTPLVADITVSKINKLTAPDAVQYERFSFYATALDGDTAVVGVASDECDLGGCGSAVVFERNATTGVFEQSAKLTASDAASSDQFGLSVGIEGDTIVVGAYGDDDGGSASGSAYVFVKSQEGWSDMNETAKLSASDAELKNHLGYSITINSDTIVVGAYGDQNAPTNVGGAAYVYEKPQNGWIDTNETAKLTASDTASQDTFGSAVAISGNTIVVGAYGHDGGTTNEGAAYLFVKPQEGWRDANETAKLTAYDPAYNDYFGSSVAIENDVVLVSAYLKGSVGHVYLFEKPHNGWTDTTQSVKLTASDPELHDTFGKSLDIQGNFIAIGAHFGDENGATNSGTVYLFTKPAGGWSESNETLKFWPDDTTTDSYFGDTIQISGNRMIIGAPLDPCDDGLQCGAAYMYELQQSNEGMMNPALLMYLLH